MKSPDEIEAQVRSRLSAALKTRLSTLNLRLPASCVHNLRHNLDVRKTSEGEPNEVYNRIDTPSGQTIGLCMLGSEDTETWLGNICEDPIDAQRCPYFTPLKDKATVIEEFKEQIMDVEWLRLEMPDVASLVWVLDKPVKLPLWAKLRAWLFRTRLEPKVSTDLTKLLPGPNETVNS